MCLIDSGKRTIHWFVSQNLEPVTEGAVKLEYVTFITFTTHVRKESFLLCTVKGEKLTS